MPQADNSRGGQTRAKKVKKKPAYTPPPSRSDAAQRTGARTPKPKPAPKPPSKPVLAKQQERQYESQGKAVEKDANRKTRLRKARRGKSDAAQGNRTSEAADFKQSREYIEAVRAARKARYDRADDAEKKRLFGNPREDAKNPKVLARFKAEDDRLAELNRDRLRKTVDQELSGQGSVAKFAAKVANEITKPRGKKGDKGAGGTSFAAALVPGLNLQPKKLRELNERAIKDAINLPAQAVPSVYVPAAGAVEAAKGRPERLKKYVEDVKQTDPIYNTVAAGVAAARGDKKAAKSHIKKAGKSASEHPGFTLAEVVGVKGTLGRGGGNVMRTGVVGKGAKRAASTVREPARVPGTRVVQKREFSRDVSRKAVQVATEKRRIKRADKTRAKARAESDPDVRAELVAKANRQDPRVADAREIRRRVDERVAANEDVRRLRRTRATNETREALKPARKSERGVLSLVAQRITRASKEDLKAYRDELKLEFDGLDSAGKRANRSLRKAIDGALKDPKFDPSRLESVAKAYEAVAGPRQKPLVERGLLAEGQESRAKLIPYAVRNMGAKHDRDKGLVDAHGEALPNEKILEHMSERGVSVPAYVTQAPNMRGGRNFNVRSERAQAITSKRRTGEATRKGTFDVDPETLVENVARSQGLKDATDGFRGIVDEFATRGSSGKVRAFQNRGQAVKAAANLEAETGARFRPIQLNPFQGRREQLESLMDDVDSDQQLTGPGGKSPVVEAMEGALKGEGEGPWALVPEEAAARLQTHLGQMNPDPLHKTLQTVNSAFRRNVLSLSTTWAFGNVAEATLRAALAKAGPRSYARGKRLLKNIEAKNLDAAEELAVRAVGGGHYSTASRFHMNRQAEQFRGTPMEGVANALGKFWRTPGPKQAASVWHWYTSHAFELMSRVESGFQTAMLGRAVKNIADPEVARLASKAADKAATGKVDTNTMVQLGRAVDRMYGRYGKRSPSERYLIDHYTPFAAWYINAVNFVVRTLPRDHPTTLALIAQAEFATEEWRKDHGLDKWMKGAVPGWLQGSVPVGKDGKLRASRFTPFGLAAEPLESTAGLVLPQFSAPLMAMKGMDWTGRSLGGFGEEAADDQKAKAAASAFATSYIPALSLGLRLHEQGPAALNPVKVTRPKKKDSAKKVRRKPASSTDVLKRSRSSSSDGGGFSVGDYSGSSAGSSGSSDFSISSY